MNIAGVTISRAAAEKIAAEALVIGEQHSYCEEVEEILRELGFPIPSFNQVVTLEVTISGDGRAREVHESYGWSAYHDGDNVETDNIRVVGVKSL